MYTSTYMHAYTHTTIWLQSFVVENFRNFHNYMIITKILFIKLLFIIMNTGTNYLYYIACHHNRWVCSSTFSQVLCSGVIVTAFIFAACYSGSSEGNGLWLQRALSVDFHPLYVAIPKHYYPLHYSIHSIINLVLYAVHFC